MVIEASSAPIDKYINMVYETGIKIMHNVGAVRHALKLKNLGMMLFLQLDLKRAGIPGDS